MEKPLTPFFSVIIPVYNKKPFLDVAIQSLQSQTYKNFEIIAIDDGSTDGSLEALQRYSKDGVVSLYTRGDPGPGGYAARNYGAGYAKGEWLVFFDADDICSSCHLEEFFNNIKKTSKNEIGLYVNSYSKKISERTVPCTASGSSGILGKKQALRLFSKSDYIHMNGACIKKELFEKYGGFPEGEFLRGGDVYFWLKVISNEQFTFYSHSITSSWILDNSGVTKNVKNLSQVHPVSLLSTALHNKSEAGLSFSEWYYLHRCINRKIISWMVEKKTNNIRFKEDAKSLSYLSITPRQLAHLLSLILPDKAFNYMRMRSPSSS